PESAASLPGEGFGDRRQQRDKSVFTVPEQLLHNKTHPTKALAMLRLWRACFRKVRLLWVL
ncbi:MAG: hypothetical protein IJI26_06710, partial [Clostridia bacterium]|nr:hypothetical protein [Clostridia bacterium]